MHKPLEYNGKKYSEGDAYRTARATAAPKSMSQPDDMGEDEPTGKPMQTTHNSDGSHTTTHEDGKEHNSENLEALKQHLDKFLSEEEGEKSDGDDWE